MPASLLPLLIINTLFTAAQMAIVTVIGPLMRELGLSEWHGGAIVTAGGLCWMLSARAWGRRSDHVGRKPVLAAATVGGTASFALLAALLFWLPTSQLPLLTSFGLLLLARGLLGLCYAGIPPASAAWIADTVASHARTGAMARLGAANAIGMVLGPPLLGALAALHLATPIAAATLLCVLACALLLRLPAGHPQAQDTGAAMRLLDRRLRLPLLTGFLAMGAVLTAQLCIGFLAMDRLGLSQQQAAAFTGRTLGLVGVTLIVTQLSVSKRPAVRPVSWLALGALLGAAGMLAAALAGSTLALTLAYIGIACGMGMLFPAAQAMVANAAAGHEQGAAAGTLSTAQALACVLLPLAATLLYQRAAALPYALAALALALLAMAAARQRRTDLRLATQSL